MIMIIAEDNKYSKCSGVGESKGDITLSPPVYATLEEAIFRNCAVDGVR